MGMGGMGMSMGAGAGGGDADKYVSKFERIESIRNKIDPSAAAAS